MNIKLIKFLASICAGLCFIIACEWGYAIFAQNRLLSDIQAVDTKKKQPVKLPSIDLTKQAESSYVDLVARPLFIQGRKPVAETENVAATVATATDTFNWSLNGVYTQKNSLYALFSRTTTKVPKDNFRKVTKNNDIDGWKLIEIHKDKVVVSQGDKQKELPLRKPKPKDAQNTNVAKSLVSPPMPNQEGIMPNQDGQVLVPNEQQPIAIPETLPEADPEAEQPIDPELIPDETNEPFFENSENEQFQ